MRLTRQEKLARCGSLSNWQMTSLILARSTNAGRPLHTSQSHHSPILSCQHTLVSTMLLKITRNDPRSQTFADHNSATPIIVTRSLSQTSQKMLSKNMPKKIIGCVPNYRGLMGREQYHRGIRAVVQPSVTFHQNPFADTSQTVFTARFLVLTNLA